MNYFVLFELSKIILIDENETMQCIFIATTINK